MNEFFGTVGNVLFFTEESIDIPELVNSLFSSYITGAPIFTFISVPLTITVNPRITRTFLQLEHIITIYTTGTSLNTL